MITLIPTATPAPSHPLDRLSLEPANLRAPLDACLETADAPAAGEAIELSGYPAYLQQAGQHKVLSMEEELRLAVRIQAGRVGEGRFTADALAARDELIRHNLKFAVYCAGKYARSPEEREELTSAANHGLVVAAERFLAEKQVRFTTYASWAIYSLIMAEIGRRRVVDLPRNIRETLKVLRRHEATLLQVHGRAATDAELAAAMQEDEHKVASLRRLAQGKVSLDAPIGEDSDTTLGDTLCDDEAAGTAEQAALRLDAALIQEHLRTLDAREALIIQLRTGLNDGAEWTLDEVGGRLNVSRERVRQLEERAYRKLRALLVPASAHKN
ncbi:MAG: RNA polymerase sigma factor RpoD/SigA [Verrucomicrobia bacterium]|nr:RNA polymerase sigma factor RpoD/SigA [Verrucomicrobiota bacterium]